VILPVFTVFISLLGPIDGFSIFPGRPTALQADTDPSNHDRVNPTHPGSVHSGLTLDEMLLELQGNHLGCLSWWIHTRGLWISGLSLIFSMSIHLGERSSFRSNRDTHFLILSPRIPMWRNNWFIYHHNQACYRTDLKTQFEQTSIRRGCFHGG